MLNTQKYEEMLKVSLSETIASLSEIAILSEDESDWEIRTDDIMQSDADDNSQADVSEEADERISILAELENKYQHTKLALQKIATGTYGICEISGELIEEDRLTANPAARTCKAHMEEEYLLPL